MDTTKICLIIKSGSKKSKIKILKKLEKIKNPNIIKNIISMLGEKDKEVIGETFSTLLSNTNKISTLLTGYMNTTNNKKIKAFLILILANRKSYGSIPAMIDTIDDNDTLVRSCVISALGYLKAHEAKNYIHKYIHDNSLEVKKSALNAIICMHDKLSQEELKVLSKEKDVEIIKLISAINIF